MCVWQARLRPTCADFQLLALLQLQHESAGLASSSAHGISLVDCICGFSRWYLNASALAASCSQLVRALAWCLATVCCRCSRCACPAVGTVCVVTLEVCCGFVARIGHWLMCWGSTNQGRMSCHCLYVYMRESFCELLTASQCLRLRP